MEFLENNILSNAKHSFHHGFSTITQLVEFLPDISQALSTGNQIDAIFIDFPKAFETVTHSRLLHKLLYYT